MRYLFSCFFIASILSADIDNSFITKYEYGQMLYNNPRGVGCNLCHKNANKKVVIAKYKELDRKTQKMINKEIVAPAINNVTFEKFLKKLKADKTESKVMPTYFLTNEELASLYYYIKNIKKK